MDPTVEAALGPLAPAFSPRKEAAHEAHLALADFTVLEEEKSRCLEYDFSLLFKRLLNTGVGGAPFTPLYVIQQIS